MRQSVAIFASSYAPNVGGVEEHVAQFAAELRQRSWRLVVLTNRWPDSLPVFDGEDGVAVHRLAFAFPGRHPARFVRFLVILPSTLVRSVRIVRAAGAGVVHVHCVSTNALYGWLTARLLRLPLVVTLHGELTMDAAGIYDRSPMLRALLRHLLRRADRITACSRQTLEEAQLLMGVEVGARGSVIHSGVRLDAFDAATPETARRDFVLAIGRHVREKGFDVLLDAFARSELAAELDLVVAGDGAVHSDLVRKAALLGVSDTVRFVGRTDRARTASLFRGCRFFVLPSRREPLGIVNLEAMAARKAIVASNVGGVPEIVVDDVTGLLVPPDDPAALAVAMCRLAHDGDLATRLGAAGRARAADLSWGRAADAYLELYETDERAT